MTSNPRVDASLAKFFPSQRKMLAVSARATRSSMRLIGRTLTLMYEVGQPSSSDVFGNEAVYQRPHVIDDGARFSLYEQSFLVEQDDTVRISDALVSVSDEGTLEALKRGRGLASELGAAGSPVTDAQVFWGFGATFGAGFVTASSPLTETVGDGFRVATVAIFVPEARSGFRGEVDVKSSTRGARVQRIVVNHTPR